jgi:hypothetical protein
MEIEPEEQEHMGEDKENQILNVDSLRAEETGTISLIQKLDGKTIRPLLQEIRKRNES